MFNHHFFVKDSKEVYKQFLEKAKERLVIVTDPPFGGKCELVGKTLESIADDWRSLHDYDSKKEPKMMWIFPYFMETKISKAASS